MAVVDTKTTQLSTQDTAGDGMGLSGSVLYTSVASVEVAAGDDDGSKYRLLRLPANAVLVSLEVAADALGTSAAYNIGTYYPTSIQSGAVIDADEFASSVAMATAIAWTNILEEAAATDISKIGQPLWQRTGLTAAVGHGIDIVATSATNGDAAGTIAIRARYYLD
jgi:hypothetical protein